MHKSTEVQPAEATNECSDQPDLEEPTVIRVLEEITQAPRRRQALLKQLETCLEGRRVVSYFTSFRTPMGIEDSDADILEGILQKFAAYSRLTLVLNSPGGSGLAAERIAKVCRHYSHGGYEVIVPKMAKSAATAICLGASRVLMSETSELGPIDPQTVIAPSGGGPIVRISVWSLIAGYRELLEEAATASGRIEPYLLELGSYDHRLIKQCEQERDLARQIAVSLLKTGMMKDRTEDQIEEAIIMLLDPEETMSHGRPIYPDDVEAMGLNVSVIEHRDPLWQAVWEVYVRTSRYVESGPAAKVIETAEHTFSVGKGD